MVIAFAFILSILLAFFIGAAYGAEPDMTNLSASPSAKTNSSYLAPMPALGAESAYMGLLLERSRWDEALRWVALADVGSGTSEAVGASNAGLSGATNAAVGGATPQPGPAPSGDCSGYPSYVPTWRESNNQPDVVNRSSGAMGCAQLMPMHFAPGGTCADLDTSYAGQRECAWRLPASAWAG